MMAAAEPNLSSSSSSSVHPTVSALMSSSLAQADGLMQTGVSFSDLFARQLQLADLLYISYFKTPTLLW